MYKKRSEMTPEELEAVHAKAAEQYATKRQMMSEEELDAKRAVDRARAEKRKTKRTPEELETKRAKRRQLYAKNKEVVAARRSRSNLTPEELEAQHAKDNARWASLSPEQRDILNAARVEHHKKNPPSDDEKELKRQRERIRNRTPEGRYNNMLATAKRRAKKRETDLSVSLTFEEYAALIAKTCIYCNEEMGKPSVAGTGLDRIDNARGYHFDNVNPCCTACNTIRGCLLTVEETHAAIQAILAVRKQHVSNTNPTPERPLKDVTGDTYRSGYQS
jgi:hypothetical protein